jgi:CRISPR-associated protein Csx3
MARTYRAQAKPNLDGTVTVELAFGEPATNAEIVPDAIAAIAELELAGGPGIKFNGPASLPVAFALAHAVAHEFAYVACYDPKLGKYVVAISHDPRFRPGQLID